MRATLFCPRSQPRHTKNLYVINEVIANPESTSVGRRCRCGTNLSLKKWTSDGEPLVSILQLAFPGLESFSLLTGHIILSWDNFPPTLQAALRNIINLSSIRSLKLALFTNVPITVFPDQFQVRLLQFTENFFSIPEKAQDTTQAIVLSMGRVGTPHMHVEHLKWKATFKHFLLCECLYDISELL